MAHYEYKVIPAPSKGKKAPGVKGTEARFAHGLEQVMNEMGADGWEYQRSDILPSEERQGLTSSHTVYRSVLVFRRARDVEQPPVIAEEKVEPVIEDQPPEEPIDAETEPAEESTPEEPKEAEPAAQFETTRSG